VKVLVVGAQGMLGTEIMAALQGRGVLATGVDLHDVDITDQAAVRTLLLGEKPSVVINCAAYTAVDRAEAEEELALRVNGDGPRHLADAAAAVDALLVHFSTDFVFDGDQRTPYRPSAQPNPVSAYGRTKLAGEAAVLGSGCDHLIIRTSWLYGAAGPNFVKAILTRAANREPLRIVNDQTGRPTWAGNLAVNTLSLLDVGARGLLHVTDGGEAATWLEFGAIALGISGHDVQVTGVTTQDWGAPAARPAYSVLDLTDTEDVLGRPMEPWDIALERFLTTEPS